MVKTFILPVTQVMSIQNLAVQLVQGPDRGDDAEESVLQ